MNQALYAHMNNKRKMKKKRNFLKSFNSLLLLTKDSVIIFKIIYFQCKCASNEKLIFISKSNLFLLELCVLYGNRFENWNSGLFQVSH
jgi:hypothetical protein